MLAKYWTFWFPALGCVAFLGDLQGWLVEAGTISGTGVTLGGLDNFAETVETYLKGNVGKMMAMVLAMAGIAMVVMGRRWPGDQRPGLGHRHCLRAQHHRPGV